MGTKVRGTNTNDVIHVFADKVRIVNKWTVSLNKSGNNNILGLCGKDTITIKGGKLNTINGGKGNDDITVTRTIGEGNKISGGSGNDEIYIKGGKKIKFTAALVTIRFTSLVGQVITFMVA